MEEQNNLDNKKGINKILLYFLLMVIILGIGTYLFINKNKITDNKIDTPNVKNDKKQIVSEEKTEKDVNSSEYTSNSLNIKFTLPPNWKEITLDELSYLPEFFSEPKIILENNKKSCVVLGYVNFHKDDYDFQQTSNTERMKEFGLMDGGLVSGKWFALSDAIPLYMNLYQQPKSVGKLIITEYKEPREKIDGEFKQANGFYLYDINNSKVSDDCENDFFIIATTKDWYYKPITLNNSSKGILRIARTFLYQDTHKTQSHILFSPENTEDNFLVEIMPPGAGGLGNTIIYNNKIYFIAGDYEKGASVQYYNIENGEFGAVEDTVGKYAYILSSLPIDKDLYYITASDEYARCLDMPRADCPKLSLYKYNFDKDSVELISEEIRGSSILGTDNKGNLYFATSWGDAGVWFATIYKYEDGITETYKEYSDVTQIEEYKNFVSTLNTMRGYQSILLENGKLLPGPEISEYSKNNYFFID